MRTFLLVFDAAQVERNFVVERVDAIAAIEDWVAFFDNALCIVSQHSAEELCNMLIEAMPQVQFIVSEVEAGKRNGWLPQSVWDFLSQARDAKSKRAAK